MGPQDRHESIEEAIGAEADGISALNRRENREFEIGQIYVQISNSRVAACCCCRTFREGLVREVG